MCPPMSTSPQYMYISQLMRFWHLSHFWEKRAHSSLRKNMYLLEILLLFAKIIIMGVDDDSWSDQK